MTIIFLLVIHKVSVPHQIFLRFKRISYSFMKKVLMMFRIVVCVARCCLIFSSPVSIPVFAYLSSPACKVCMVSCCTARDVFTIKAFSNYEQKMIQRVWLKFWLIYIIISDMPYHFQISWFLELLNHLKTNVYIKCINVYLFLERKPFSYHTYFMYREL